MKYLINTAIIAIVSLVITSCGTGKKLKAAVAQNTDLANQIGTLNSKLADADKQLAQLKTENIQYGNEAKDCRVAKEAIAAKVTAMQNNLKEKGTSIHQILAKAEAATKKLEDAGATVEYKNGLAYVSMPDKFLFKTNSSAVGDKGKEGLSAIAQVLTENPRVTAMIVGNTDTMHVKGIADNWSLSTERANAVVRILRDTYKIDPARLTAAGRGKYNPVADNGTPEGREKNRRIEIVLNPDIAALFEPADK